MQINKYVSLNACAAFVDGSFIKGRKGFGFGVVMFYMDSEQNIHKLEYSKKIDDVRFNDARNVAGEIFGALKAIDFAYNHNIKQITIFYDYTGIEKWALGKWKANSEIAKHYIAKISDYKTKVEIKFYKIKAHSDNKYNDLADKLAKQALGR
ncbi:reverse transcriptase-like protein [Spiroplasma endosymbiont of Anurida maritima]|uniref:RNase H family protein n=1 Tax=Spiroplasma endosymbiont of Anurida maritima TaxID=2967972 RepID=UPI0036D262F5